MRMIGEKRDRNKIQSRPNEPNWNEYARLLWEPLWLGKERVFSTLSLRRFALE